MAHTASSVLVLDDDPADLAAMAALEVGAGVVLHTCRDPQSAERLLSHIQVDVALVAHDLGTAASGLHWLAGQRRRDPDCFRIITSANADLAFAISAINHGGVDGFLPKPWPPALALQLIHQGCEAALIRRHNRSLVSELGERNSQLLELTTRLEDLVEQRTHHLREAMDQLRSAHEELQTQQGQPVELETRGAIAQVVRGLAHELNNPLAVILGYTQRLQRTFAKDDPEAQRRLGVILDEVGRCVGLVDQLGNLSLPLAEELRSCQPSDLLAQAEARMRAGGRKVPLCQIDGPLPRVLAAERSLVRVFEQVLDNAVLNGAHRVELSALQHGSRVRLTLANDGETPTDEQIRNAMRPFYTTHAQRGNRGLGLPMAQAQLRDQGGTLELRSRGAGIAGAATLIDLSAAEAHAAAPPAAAGTVLVVDDQPLVADLVADALAELGYATEIVGTVAAARAALGRQAFALALVDRHLPDGDGLALARELLGKPGVVGKVAVVSGDAGDADGLPVLTKPFHLDAIAKLVLSLSEPSGTRTDELSGS